MNMKSTYIDYQEITDNQILYKMFGDEEYKRNYERLQAEILASMIMLNIKGKYLMLRNFPENNTTNYTTVIKVEDDARQTFDKLMNLLHSLGTIHWIKIHADSMEVKIKNSYKLHLFDFTEGVI